MGKIKERHVERIEALKATRWFRANNPSDKLKDATVDVENKAIYGVSVCTEGEALGHDVWLDNDFITDLVSLGNAQKQGVKARFGHPNMSGEALGTYIGRFHNFRKEGTKAIADLYFDESAEVSPQGNLVEYLLKFSQTSPDMFGASIVFSMGEIFYKKTTGEKVTEEQWWEDQRNKAIDYNLETDLKGHTKEFITIKLLHGADLVDEPAANADGLFSKFSSNNLHADKFAVIATDFLKAHPQIAAFVRKNPHKITEFMAKFEEKPLDTDDDDELDEILIDDEKPEGKPEAEQNTEGGTPPTIPAPAPATDEEALYSRLYSRIEAKFSAQITALEKRVKDLETDPNADPIFSKRDKDNDGSKARPKRSWEVEYDKRNS